MLKTAKKSVEIVDQYSDRSGAVLIKIAANMTDQKLAKIAIDTRFSLPAPDKPKELFPADTPADAFMSRVYFEGQREKLAAEEAEAIDARLGKYEELHNIHPRVRMKKQGQTKTAAYVFELLPSCNIAGSSDLIKAGNDFSANFSRLSQADCREFSKNFFKAAAIIDPAYKIPDAVRLFNDANIEANPDLAENLRLRKLAAKRAGKKGTAYKQLYDCLASEDLNSYSIPDLTKIAEAIDFADNEYILIKSKTGKTLPTAWESVFRVKQAEDSADNADNLTMLDKADIVSRYGEGILEEVENEDGSVDKNRLKEILKSLGITSKFKSDSDSGETTDNK